MEDKIILVLIFWDGNLKSHVAIALSFFILNYLLICLKLEI